MNSKRLPLLMLSLISLLIASCTDKAKLGPTLRSTREILVTSESGEKLSSMANIPFQSGKASGTVITIYPDSTKQTIHGIGTSFTESSAFVLAHLEPEQRREVMQNIYGESGANFALTRTHIGSCDFTVEGKYSYADEGGDDDLSAFSIEADLAGFDTAKHPEVRERSCYLLPMIQEALAIKQEQQDQDLKIIASAWTAPSWMKDVETQRVLNGLDLDSLHACATVNGEGLLSVQLLNTTKAAIQCKLQIAEQFVEIEIPANSVQTVKVQL